LKSEINWSDLYKLFKTTPIVIKNCFRFGLKEISKCMNDHGMIKIDTSILNSMSGLDASLLAYSELKSGGYDSDTMKNIKRYNEFDVNVLSVILNYMRENLI
jgi:predicted RecB family nuclease